MALARRQWVTVVHEAESLQMQMRRGAAEIATLDPTRLSRTQVARRWLQRVAGGVFGAAGAFWRAGFRPTGGDGDCRGTPGNRESKTRGSRTHRIGFASSRSEMRGQVNLTFSTVACPSKASRKCE